jgi:hypothetical protein
MTRHHRAPEPPPIFSTFHYGRDIIETPLVFGHVSGVLGLLVTHPVWGVISLPLPVR